jgi:hypothetical protein
MESFCKSLTTTRRRRMSTVTAWKFNRKLYGDCDICEGEDVDLFLYAKESQVITICATCKNNIAKHFGIEFEDEDGTK